MARILLGVSGGISAYKAVELARLAIGVATTMAAGYQDHIAFLGRGLSEVVPYIVLLLVLLWRPSGVFGTKEVTRV